MLLAVGSLAVAYVTVVRPRQMTWGATPVEVSRQLPGDDLVSRPTFNATRAISIAAPPEAVWPWLVQVGCGRAGWYSNDLLDNLGRPSAREILPELQSLEVGQWVPMAPTPPSPTTALRVDGFEIDRWLLWCKPDSTWSWTFTRLDAGRTRLVTRVHAAYDWTKPTTALLGVVLMEFGDFAMMRRMLLGIRERAESTSGPCPRAADRPAAASWALLSRSAPVRPGSVGRGAGRPRTCSHRRIAGSYAPQAMSSRPRRSASRSPAPTPPRRCCPWPSGPAATSPRDRGSWRAVAPDEA